MKRFIVIVIMLIALVTWFVIRTTEKASHPEGQKEVTPITQTDSSAMPLKR